jgi:membrane-associated protease RseP (regulator of RpoE activity)
VKHNHFRLFAILFGLLVCAAACYGVFYLWNVPAEGHWTPAAFAPPLAQVSDRVEVFVFGEPILKAVEAQNLVLKRKGAETPVAAGDIVASVNNYDRDRFTQVRTMLALAAVAGGAFVLLLVGLFTPLIKALKPPDIVDLHLLEE